MEDCTVFKSPENMKSVIGKEVEIKTVDNKVHVGDVYVIDPLSKTVVLTNGNRDKVDLILHHAIQEFKLLSCDSKRSLLEVRKVHEDADNSERKEKVRSWLKDHFITVVEQGDVLKIDDHVTIEPPYGLEQCYCSNTIILDRLKAILLKMPM